MKFLSGSGQPLLLAIVNSFVHTIMYGYYFITSFKPELKQSIWWKKHITQVQLVRIQSFPAINFQNSIIIFSFVDSICHLACTFYNSYFHKLQLSKVISLCSRLTELLYVSTVFRFLL